MIPHELVYKRARSIAEAAAARDGLVEWSVGDRHVELANKQLMAETGIGAKFDKREPVGPDDNDLLLKGLAAQARRLPGGAGREVTIFGDVETEDHGRVQVSHSTIDDSISIHGVHTLLADVDRDLRQLIVSTSAAFNAAASAEDQVKQREILGLIISSVLRRDEKLDATVKEVKTRERYD